jgi:phosphatidylglycerophosphate synthase
MHKRPKSKYSTDYYLYKGIDKISPKICKIHPNLITLAAALIIIPIIINILKDQSTFIFILLLLIRHILDGFDGSVARKCDKGTNIGAYMDIIFDMIFFIALYVAIFYKILTDKKLRKLILEKNLKIVIIILALLLFIPTMYYFCYEIYELSKKEKHDTNKLNQLFQDNETLMFIILGIIIKYLLKNN